MAVGEIVDDFEIPNISEGMGSPIRVRISRWKGQIAVGYHSMDDIRNSQVTQLYWYKNIDGFEHEYLVAKCCRPGDLEFYLRVERDPIEDNDLAADEAVSEPHTSPNIDRVQLFSKRVLLAINGNVEAEGPRRAFKLASRTTARIGAQEIKNHALKAIDTVTRVDNLEGSLEDDVRVHLIARCLEFQKPFYVRDLAFLADAVSGYQPHCQIFLYHCFWYARSVINVAAAVYRPTVVHGSGFWRAGTFEVLSGDILIGRLTFSEDRQHETNSIREAFQMSLKSHTAEVQNRFHEQFGDLQKMQWDLQEEKQKRQQLGC